MYKLFKIPSILILIVFSFHLAQGQEDAISDMELDAAQFNFPPLQVVIDSVIKNSAMVGFQSNTILAREAALASEKLRWSENLGLQADTRYGNLNNFSSNEDGEALSQVLTT
jgi:hypothetical protein